MKILVNKQISTTLQEFLQSKDIPISKFEKSSQKAKIDELIEYYTDECVEDYIELQEKNPSLSVEDYVQQELTYSIFARDYEYSINISEIAEQLRDELAEFLGTENKDSSSVGFTEWINLLATKATDEEVLHCFYINGTINQNFLETLKYKLVPNLDDLDNQKD